MRLRRLPRKKEKQTNRGQTSNNKCSGRSWDQHRQMKCTMTGKNPGNHKKEVCLEEGICCVKCYEKVRVENRPWNLAIRRQIHSVLDQTTREESKEIRGPSVGRLILLCTANLTAGVILVRYIEPGNMGESCSVWVMSAETWVTEWSPGWPESEHLRSELRFRGKRHNGLRVMLRS